MEFLSVPQRRGRVYKQLAEDLDISLSQVTSTLELFDEGNTVPFVARYRKEVTGCLSDSQLRTLFSRMIVLDELEAKRMELSKELAQQDSLTETLQIEIDSADSIDALDEIYLPFKEQIKSKGTIAKEKGLEPLTRRILENGFDLSITPVHESDLQGCQDIIAEEICRIPEIKQVAQEAIEQTGELHTLRTEFANSVLQANQQSGNNYHYQQQQKVSKGLTLSQNANDPNTYEKYYDSILSVRKAKPSQILAINRAEKLGFLSVKLNWNPNPVHNLCFNKATSEKSLTTDSLKQIIPALRDGVEDLLKPSVEPKARALLTERAIADAIDTFSTNLWSLLLTPPLIGVPVMGIDPGFRTGCKLCICNPQGSILETRTIYPFNGWASAAGAALVSMLRTHEVKAIALGDGVASRETESFLSDVLRDACLPIGWTLVSEDGASVYSASELASHELPTLDVSLRGAVSIARRLQDPLAELVKIDPAHLGIGLYQHDMDKTLLAERLKGVVECAVNTVGVDINTASASLLSYVAGLFSTLAEKIVQHRDLRGEFRSRENLLEIEEIDDKVLKQCAGFLRIRNASNALDNTGVHPESYYIVHSLFDKFFPDQMLSENITNQDLEELRGCLMEFEDEEGEDAWEWLAEDLEVGIPTLMDIVENIMSPGRDIRGQATSTSLKWSEVSSIEDLEVGDQFLGTVKNVVDFGAFVDINVGVTGLVHVGQMKSQDNPNFEWIDPHEVVRVGDKVHVEIIVLDLDRKRISLRIIDHEL